MTSDSTFLRIECFVFEWFVFECLDFGNVYIWQQQEHCALVTVSLLWECHNVLNEGNFESLMLLMLSYSFLAG